MKYLVMVAAVLVLSIGQSVGQTATSIDAVDVPKKVVAAFGKNGSVENVDWTLEKQYYIASFYNEKESVFLQLYYDADGNWIKSLKELEENKLPSAIKAGLASLYGQDYAILLITEEKYSDKVDYQVEIENAEGMFKLHFDKSGKLLAKAETVQELEIIDDEDED